MAELRAQIRERLRRRLVEGGGAPEFADPDLFARVVDLLQQAVDARERGGLLLSALLGDEEEWTVDAPLRFSSHRRVLGPVLIFVKRRLLLPVTRWLHEYSAERFRRQQEMNRLLLAGLETLALENARLRRDLEALRQPADRPTAPESPAR